MGLKYYFKKLTIYQVRTFADIDRDKDDLDWKYFDGRAMLHPQYSVET